MNSTHEIMLEAREVFIRYGRDRDVVQGINLAIHQKQISCIVGPNGAGKSSILASLAGVVSPHKGSIFLNDTPLPKINTRQKARRIGFLPQIVRPSIPYTVYELVTLGRYARGTGFNFETSEDRHAVKRAMEETRTDHLANRLFSEISGGERQRVLIASVLAGEPEVLLLDEPTASLDIGLSGTIFANLEELAKSGRGIGVVTHDLNLAGQFADTVILLSEGRITAQGPPSEVFTEKNLRLAYGSGFILAPQPGTTVPAVLPAGRRENK